MEDIGIVHKVDIGMAQQVTMVLGFTYRAHRLSCSVCLQITGASQWGQDLSLMANWTGIGKLGKEEITGHPMAGEDGGTKLTTDTMDPMEAVDTMEVMVTMGALDPMEAVDTTEAEDLTEDPMEGCRY